jgi:hypothetical protein
MPVASVLAAPAGPDFLGVVSRNVIVPTPPFESAKAM